MEQQNKLNVGEFKVLVAMEQGAKYGLEIQRRVSELSGVEVSLGGVYTTLHRLEKKRLVVGGWADDEEARRGARRRNYRLTVEGKRALKRTRDTLREFVHSEDDASEFRGPFERAEKR
jgi:DNA-binding PadR family transcriptional regulator